ncbi:serine/threonine-protein kinase [Mycobacterium sp.]|uniref:serine/threonine-protein kinase n=1 Tax=Mycobacterium sp. TaxID=1785 RepID=UPI003C77AD2D
MTLEVGQVFAGYTILRVLGSGGMGAVYLASHPRLPREDALKVLPADLTVDPEFRTRFLREADLAATLSHPHIVGIYDRGEDDGRFWISMDYIAGTDAGRLLSEHYPRGMPLEHVAAIATAVGSALDYAHHRGLLHRDVKPANILLTEPDGQPRRVFLADFGLARRIDDVSGLTATNMTVGTVAYVAPEQLRGAPADGRADQYALAATMFHLLAGAPPYDSPIPSVVIRDHVSAPPPSISAHRPDLAALDHVFARALAKNPAERFGSCGEFAQHLEQSRSLAVPYPDTQPAIGVAPPRSRRTRMIAALAGIALLLVAGGVVAGIKLTQHHSPAGSAAPKTARPPINTGNPAPSTGPFTGIYRATFGPGSNLDDVRAPGVGPLTNTYAVRSACGSNGCVATASRLSGEFRLASTVVFDQVDGRWVAVTVDTDRCRDGPSEIWQMFTLDFRPDGTLTGEYRGEAGNACALKRSVTFTRTGDVDLSSLPDPATLPARVVSPAQALHGRYHISRTFSRWLSPQQEEQAVTTDCLRTGDRCMSYFHSPSTDTPLVFSGGNWMLNVEHSDNLAGCFSLGVKTTAEYPLPQSPQDPIVVLTGHGHHEQTGSCAVEVDFDETYSRTGD